MPNLEAELATLKADTAKTARRLATELANRDRAKAAIEASVRRLSEEYGVSSIEEAKELLVKLEAEVRTEMDRISEELEQINGS